MIYRWIRGLFWNYPRWSSDSRGRLGLSKKKKKLWKSGSSRSGALICRRSRCTSCSVRMKTSTTQSRSRVSMTRRSTSPRRGRSRTIGGRWNGARTMWVMRGLLRGSSSCWNWTWLNCQMTTTKISCFLTGLTHWTKSSLSWRKTICSTSTGSKILSNTLSLLRRLLKRPS